MPARILSFVLLGLVLLASAVPGYAASWNAVRDAAMTIRERGDPARAYALVTAASTPDPEDAADREFLAGYIAFRYLNSPATALKHFRVLIDKAAALPREWQRRGVKAKAGYWLGEVVAAGGRKADAEALWRAAAAYRDTFHGMIAASKVGLQDSPRVMAAFAAQYPRPKLYWYDPRIRSELVLAIVKAESSFKPTAVSGAGAKGLMQLMDGTASRVGRSAGVAIDLGLVARNGDYNIAVGSRHLADLMKTYDGNVVLAAAAYNAGEKRVDEWLVRFGDPRRGVAVLDWVEHIPFKETREYVQKVGGNYLAYLALTAG